MGYLYAPATVIIAAAIKAAFVDFMAMAVAQLKKLTIASIHTFQQKVTTIVIS